MKKVYGVGGAHIRDLSRIKVFDMKSVKMWRKKEIGKKRKYASQFESIHIAAVSK